MEDCLKWLDKQCVVGLVGGSDLKKISEQMSIGNQSGQYLHRSYEMGHKMLGILVYKYAFKGATWLISRIIFCQYGAMVLLLADEWKRFDVPALQFCLLMSFQP